jgi:hypothetical protein
MDNAAKAKIVARVNFIGGLVEFQKRKEGEKSNKTVNMKGTTGS